MPTSPHLPLRAPTALALFCLVLFSQLQTAAAEIRDADPSNYRERLAELLPGDTLQLAPGRYPRLTLRDLQGAADAWITITGPEDPDTPAIIDSESCCNTVQLYNCAFLTVRNLVIDVGGLQVDAVNAKDSVSHDIRIENNLMVNFPEDQLIVGINTKSTAWNWEIRGNRIIGAGTGIYLGGSSGDAPFINGVIENNLILDPIGYCMQVKQQNDYALLDGMPAGPNRTIIRNNVFIKNDRPSTAGDRPNLLVSGFPDSGPGSMDHYEIYGNFIYYNPRESLFQGAGRIHLHDNIFVGADTTETAILLTPHQGKRVQVAHVYNNTIYGVSRGIRLTTEALESSRAVANLVFAAEPLGGPFGDTRDNVLDSRSSAGSYVNAPSTTLAEMDFYPREGAASGAPFDLSAFAGDLDYDRDFNGTEKSPFTYRGAYAGEGENPGWALAAELRARVGATPPPPPPPPPPPTDGGGLMLDAGRLDVRDGGPPDGAVSPPAPATGCSSAAASHRGLHVGPWLLLAVALTMRRRTHPAPRAAHRART